MLSFIHDLPCRESVGTLNLSAKNDMNKPKTWVNKTDVILHLKNWLREEINKNSFE
jgi:hypothetical protein